MNIQVTTNLKTLKPQYYMHYRRSIAACCLVLLSLCTWALPVRFYDAEQLSSNQITDICQDRLGYIWIGTEYGLNKFDGVHVMQYYSDDSNPESLADDIVRKLMTDREGNVWVVSNRGVQRYNCLYDNFESARFSESTAENINDILQTADGHIWLLSADHGLYELNPGSMDAHPLATVNKCLKNRSCDNMYTDSKGRLWVAYRDRGLQVIDLKNNKSHYFDDYTHTNNRAVDLTEDAQHRLFVLTYTAIYQFNERTHHFEAVVTFPRNAVYRFFKDNRQQLLVGTVGSGLWKVNLQGGDVTRVDDVIYAGGDLQKDRVYAYMEDHSGNKWIGCNQRGLVFVSGKPTPFHFLPLDKIETNNGNVLRAVHADANRHVYICQEKGGITGINDEGKALGHWMGDYTVMTMYPDSDGMFWVGTYRNGLFHLNRNTGHEEHIASTGTQRIGAITKDKQGNIYTAVFSDGLHSYTPDGKTERVLGKGRLNLTNPYLNTLFTDKDGRIWIGHYYGIDVYDPKTDKLIDVNIPAALRPAIVYALGQSHEGSIWVGSNKGLFQYYTQGKQKGQWKRFTTNEGLPNDNVSSFVITDDGTIWVSTYRGMAQIETNGTFTRYYRGNGLENWSYLRGVSAYSSVGEVIFGNQDGITYFVPKKIVKNEFAQGITLTGMRLGNTDVNVSTRSDGKSIITKMLEETDDITVSYLDNTFSLRFSSLDYRDAQNIHYEYRFDDEPKGVWHSTASGVSEIIFSHLSIGSHKLIVRAYDNGIYSPEKRLMINVTPPWYRSWGAYAFYLMLILTIAALWWRNYWNKRQAEINEEKIKFFVDISHELRSPLTLIKSPLDKMLRESHDTQTTRALRNMERNTNRLLTLVNQILSIRKIEKGQMHLQYAETPFADFVSDICHDFDYQVENRQITLNLHNEAEGMAVWIDRDNFDKVVTNLLSNAIKYISDGGQIDVTVRQIGSKLAELSVRDNGPGIDEAQLKKVFERFYQASARPAAGQMSYGIGLNLTQKIVMLHGGTIVARNRDDGNGSEFIVRLPLGKSHLSQDQLAISSVSSQALNANSQQPQIAEPVTDAEQKRRVRKKTTYHVAVVDDDEEMRSFLQTELGESYYVHVYPDGQSALEGIVDTVPDLVVSDVVMPKMDGFELLKRLKSSTKTSHIPVILLTTKTEHQSRIKGLEQGADAYVDKPFNMEELETRIANLIANRIRLRGKFSGMQEQEGTVKKVELKGNDAALMEKIMKVINERLDDSDFNVEALADDVGLSRVQLHRRMKEMTGITVGEFIRNLRLQQAAKLLEAGDTTVAQVTYAVGFANPTHFTSAFKKHFGVAPSEYMAKKQKR